MSNQPHSNDDEYRHEPRYVRKGRRLYKNPDQAKLCGVCAGLAEYFDFETWVVRVIAFSFFLFSGGTAVVAYFVACFILDPKPGSKSKRGCFGNERKRSGTESSEKRQYKPSVKEVWKKGEAPAVTLVEVEESFAKIEGKLQKMETFVTSKKYQLEKEFAQIG
jgi:phage shock protein C